MLVHDSSQELSMPCVCAQHHGKHQNMFLACHCVHCPLHTHTAGLASSWWLFWRSHPQQMDLLRVGECFILKGGIFPALEMTFVDRCCQSLFFWFTGHGCVLSTFHFRLKLVPMFSIFAWQHSCIWISLAGSRHVEVFPPGTWRDSLCSHPCPLVCRGCCSTGCLCPKEWRMLSMLWSLQNLWWAPASQGLGAVWCLLCGTWESPGCASKWQPLGFTGRTSVSGEVKQKAHLSVSQEESNQGWIVNLLLCDQAACSCVTCGPGQWSVPGLPWGSKGHSQISWLLDCSQFPSENHEFQSRKAGVLPLDPHSQALPCARSQEIVGCWGFTPALLLSAVICCKSVPCTPEAVTLPALCASLDSWQCSQRSNCLMAKGGAPSTGSSCTLDIHVSFSK